MFMCSFGAPTRRALISVPVQAISCAGFHWETELRKNGFLCHYRLETESILFGVAAMKSKA